MPGIRPNIFLRPLTSHLTSPEPSGRGCTRRGTRASHVPARFTFVGAITSNQDNRRSHPVSPGSR